MKKHLTILILIIILLLTGSAGVVGQTPYDSFAPEAWRPMLGDDATLTIDVRNESETDSVVEFVVVDIATRQVLLVNGSNQVLAVMQVEEDDVKWLSPDPMMDKYPTISPYAYCNWNPVMLIDPNGKYFTKYQAMKASHYVKFLRKKYDKTGSTVDKGNIARLIRDVGEMKKDTENEYRFRWNPFRKSETRGHGRNKDGKVIVEMISKEKYGHT